jgi:hypothetical protein
MALYDMLGLAWLVWLACYSYSLAKYEYDQWKLLRENTTMQTICDAANIPLVFD